MKNLRKSLILSSIFTFLALFLTINIFAVPYNGKEFTLKQPDGTEILVKVTGDEYYQYVDSKEGDTLIRDPQTNWICYAKINSTATDLESTGDVYKPIATNNTNARTASYTKKKLRLDPKITRQKVLDQRKRLDTKKFKLNDRVASLTLSPTINQTPMIGNIQGLTLLVNFPDVKSSINQTQINDMINKTGYVDFGNNGSVKDYFIRNSGGKLNYTNNVTAFYTAKKPKSYYDNSESIGPKAQELVTEAITALNAQGFDFSSLSTDESGYVRSLNVMYAGSPDYGWSRGLWPHSYAIDTLAFNGKKFSSYQITNIGTDLSITTFCHENGHMLMGWPDTYDYGYESKGCGDFDLMSSAIAKNPPAPNPFFRNVIAGWGSNIPLDLSKRNTMISATANSVDAYIYKTKNSKEYFMVENKIDQPLYFDNKVSGLLIWHIDEDGDNNNQQMSTAQHYMVSVEQADGLFGLERNNYGDLMDLFYAGNKTEFTSSTVPNSKLWSGEDSGLSITNVSFIGNPMTFDFSMPEGDVIPPSIPTGLKNTATSVNSVTLEWTAATDNVGLQGYNIYRNDILLNSVPLNELKYVDSGLVSGTSYTYNVSAVDTSNNVSDRSSNLIVKTNIVITVKDTTPPTTPTGLVKTFVSTSSISLKWNASKDKYGIKNYDVYRNGTKIATVTGTTYKKTGLKSKTTYKFTVKARDTSGLVSKSSAILNVTTK